MLSANSRFGRWAMVVFLIGAVAAVVGGGWFLTKVKTMHGEIIARNKELKLQRVYRVYLDRLAALQQYDLYGEVTEQNRHFVDHAKDFVPIEAVAIAKICGPVTRMTKKPPYIFFAARIQLIPESDGDSLPEVVSLSYMGHLKELHRDKAFSAVVLSSSIQAGTTKLEKDSGLIEQWLDRRSSDGLNAGTVYRPFGYNSGDIDGDGRGELVFGDELYLSSKFEISDGRFEIALDDLLQVGKDSVFLSSHTGSVLLTLEDDRLLERSWNAQDGELVTVSELGVTSEADDSHAPFKLYPLPDLNGDGSEEFAIVQPSSIEVFSLRKGDAPAKMVTIDEITDISLVGGFADYDLDGRQDFWLAQRGFEKDGRRIGRSLLISSERLNQAAGQTVSLAEVTWFELLGSVKYTDVSGIGATVSLRSGDIDGDGKPDFSVSGHRHLSDAGALYVVPGKVIEADGVIDVTDPSIMKLRGSALGQLAPPFVHWDATDYNGDGVDDIVVTADSDLCQGVGSGALYFVDGAKFLERWNQISTADDVTATMPAMVH